MYNVYTFRIRRNFCCVETFVGPLNHENYPRKFSHHEILASGQWLYCLFWPPLRTYHERSSTLSRKPVFLQQQLPICHCKHGIHARITFFWTQKPSFHRANCQCGKIFMAAKLIFVGGFNHEIWTPQKFNPQNILPTKISAYTVDPKLIMEDIIMHNSGLWWFTNWCLA